MVAHNINVMPDPRAFAKANNSLSLLRALILYYWSCSMQTVCVPFLFLLYYGPTMVPNANPGLFACGSTACWLTCHSQTQIVRSAACSGPGPKVQKPNHFSKLFTHHQRLRCLLWNSSFFFCRGKLLHWNLFRLGNFARGSAFGLRCWVNNQHSPLVQFC